MNIQKIKVIDEKTIDIITTDNVVRRFTKSELKEPERAWFDNLLSCSLSLMNYNPPK